MKKKKRKLKKGTIIIVIGIIILLVLISVEITKILNNKSIVGSWTTDNVTIYTFKRNKTGVLKVSLNEYKFTYKIEKNILFIDFESDKSTDTKYTYLLEKNKLILKGDNGEFTFTKKK